MAGSHRARGDGGLATRSRRLPRWLDHRRQVCFSRAFVRMGSERLVALAHVGSLRVVVGVRCRLHPCRDRHRSRFDAAAGLGRRAGEVLASRRAAAPKRPRMAGARFVPRLRIPNGAVDPDELRLLVVPKLPLRGFASIEIGLKYAVGVGARVAMPEVLLRVAAESPCADATAAIARRARITPGATRRAGRGSVAAISNGAHDVCDRQRARGTRHGSRGRNHERRVRSPCCVAGRCCGARKTIGRARRGERSHRHPRCRDGGGCSEGRWIRSGERR